MRLGGEQGQDFVVEAGDVIVIPAGVGHKNLGADHHFGVVGAYPDGRECDLREAAPANVRRQIKILRPCQCRRKIRFMGLTVRSRESGQNLHALRGGIKPQISQT